MLSKFFLGILLIVVVAAVGISWGISNFQFPISNVPISNLQPPISNFSTFIPSPVPISNIPSPISNLQPPNSGFCIYVPILLYHHVQPLDIAKKEGHLPMTVSPEKFDEQMSYLVEKGYQFITADELSQALFSQQKFSGKTIVITMDDGYADIYTYAFPVIKKYNIVVNVAVITGFLENKEYLSWSQLKEMINSGLAKPIDHTWSHPNLKKSTQEKIEYEITTGKQQLEEKLGITVKSFIYPYGNVDKRAIDFLQKNNFTSAFSTAPGNWQCNSFILELHRMRVGNLSLATYGL